MLLLLLVVSVVFDDTPNWPAFLGYGHSHLTSEKLPTQWAPESNIAWTAKLTGKGQSSPVVWGNKVFVTSIDGSMKDECVVTAINEHDGGVLWTHASPSSQTVRSNYFQSRSAPTPIVDRDRVYAFFETGNVIALNHDGEKVWERSLVDDYGAFESTIGLASSPLQFDNKLILLIDHEGASYLLAIDKQTGATLWKTDRDSRVSYASPAVISVGEETHLVCSSAGSVDGYRPENGELLWTYDEVGGNSQNTPIQVGDGRFLIGAAPGMHNEKEAVASKSNLCMQIRKTKDGYEPKVIWMTEKVMTSFASPMEHRGLAYWVTKAGVLYCYDVETGEQKYFKRLKQPCWATPFGLDDRIYFFGKDGVTTVIAAGPEYKLVSENQLWNQDDIPPASPGGTRSIGHEHTKDGAQDTSLAGVGTGQAAEGNGAPSRNADSGAQARRGNPEAREQGENRFADPVQYGYAFTSTSIFVRTGDCVFSIRLPNAK